MTISLGVCTDDYFVANKTPTFSASANCQIYGECSLMNPVFVLKYNSSYEEYNYLEAFNRFYYISDIVLMPGGKCRIVCAEDALYTHWNQLQHVGAWSTRSQDKVMPQLYDPDYPSRIDNSIKVMTFSNGKVFNKGENYLLTVLGGQGQSVESTLTKE